MHSYTLSLEFVTFVLILIMNLKNLKEKCETEIFGKSYKRMRTSLEVIKDILQKSKESFSLETQDKMDELIEIIDGEAGT